MPRPLLVTCLHCFSYFFLFGTLQLTENTREMVKINNFLLHFCRIIYWKCPAEKPGDGISKTLNFKIFWGSMPPDPPSCKRLRRLGKIYSRSYIFKIPLYAPVKDVEKALQESIDDCNSLLESSKKPRKKTRFRISQVSLKFWSITFTETTAPQNVTDNM